MKRALVFAAACLTLLAAPAFALVTSAPLPAQGIAPEEMAQLMSQYHLAPEPAQDGSGNPIIKGRTANVGFDVNFFDCKGGRCRDIQFQVGWSKAAPPAVTLDKINAWNSTHRFLHAYLSTDQTLWATMDARVAYGTTGNVQEYLALWRTVLQEFKSDFRL